uniref:Uncharacterized protein n=1 Tax=Setaria digitata TaxID=48799 RepID=A0A915PJ70_9BILA
MKSLAVLHALVNNAGIHGHYLYDDFLVLDDFKEVWDVNIFGVIRVTHAFKDLIKKSRGRIVICTSATTLFTVPGHGPYASSKFAIQAYINIIRHELRPYRVTVVEVCPGCFKTGMANSQAIMSSVNAAWCRAPQEVRDEYGNDYNDKVKTFVIEITPKVLTNDIKWVVDAYYEGIVAKRPKLLYRVGWNTLFQFHPYSFLPVRLQVLVMKLLMRMAGAPLPAITKKNASSRNTLAEYKGD